jgi:tetratricopeptide (TPR) repeat protein
MLVKSLNEIAPLIGERVPNARKILGFLCQDKLEIMVIYDHFQEHVHANNEAAADAIPGLGLTSFKKYGAKLLVYLRQMVPMMIEPDDDSFESIAYDNATSRILAAFRCQHLSKDIAESAFERAMSQEQPVLALECVRHLMRSVASLGGVRRKEFQELYEMSKKLSEPARIQQVSYDLTLENISYKASKKTVDKERLNYLKQVESDLRPYVGNITSIPFHTNYHSLAFDYYFTSGLYQDAFNNAMEAVEYLQDRSKYTSEFIGLSHARLCYCCAMLAQYEKGEYHLTQSLKYGEVGTINWFTSLEIGYYLYMRAGNSEKATEIYLKATRHKKFINLSDAIRETWYIIGAYLYIRLVAAGKEIPKQLPGYKSVKFQNEISQYQFDKGGLNAAALLAGLLLTHLEGQKDKIVDRIDALEKYRERYLLEGHTPRTALLLKMYLHMARSGFQRRLYGEKLTAYKAELATITPESFEWEIIPGEQMIEFMEQLEQPLAARQPQC